MRALALLSVVGGACLATGASGADVPLCGRFEAAFTASGGYRSRLSVCVGIAGGWIDGSPFRYPKTARRRWTKAKKAEKG